jgi:hypothetical protein
VSKRLNEQLAAEEPRSAPEPETAEERSERLLRKRGFRIAGLGALIFLVWEGVRLLGNIEHSFTGVVIAVGAVGLFLLFERSVEDDRKEHGDDD